MKKVIVAWLILAASFAARAQFTFTTNNGSITMTGYGGNPNALNIPATTNGYSVTGIGAGAFSNKTTVVTVTIPNTVTNIGTNAFYSCTGMTTLTLGNSLTNIRSGAFYSCSALGTLNIPDSVTNIGFGAFESCTSLTNLTLGSQVAGIGVSAFQSCTKLPGVTLPDKTTFIGNLAFCECSKLTNAMVGSNITFITENAFQWCYHLTTINVSAINKNICSVSGVVFDKLRANLLQCPEGLAGSYTVPNSVTNIQVNAFQYCVSLTNITIPNGVVIIGDGSFQMTSLSSVMIPASVTYIGTIAFNSCSKLTNISVDPNNPLYSSRNGVLFDKSQSTLLQYPGGLAGSYTIPDGVTNIGDSSFANCNYLTTLTVPGSVVSIDTTGVYNCPSLTAVYFEGNTPSLGSLAFAGDNSTAYYLPGTSGWDVWKGPPSAVLWNPQMQISGGSMAVQTNGFGFNIIEPGNPEVVVQACTNLTNPVWLPVATNTLNSGTSYFSDPQWTNYTGRFYRLRFP
jgi:hypothetical protein